MDKLDSATFRGFANYAVDQVVKFLDEFPNPELYPTVRMRLKDLPLTIVVGIDVVTNKENDE